MDVFAVQKGPPCVSQFDSLALKSIDLLAFNLTMGGAIIMQRIYIVALFAMLSFGALVQAGWAGGLWLYEEATPDLGTAGAGRAAAARDAATAAGNPAGMTRLKGSQFTVGVQALFPQIKFDTDDSSFGGGNGGNAGYFTPAASLFYVHSLTPDLKLGVAAGSYFGLGLDYDDNWAGRYYLQEGKFFTFGVNPVAAYRINKYLSVGGGFSMVVSEYSARTALRNLEPNSSDGRLKFDATDVG